jgi:hypothetical protein
MIHWLRTWRQASPALVKRAAGVLHHRLDQVAGLGRLGHGQAAVAGHALPHLAPHGRVVAGLHLGALAVGLLGVAGSALASGFTSKMFWLWIPATAARGRCRNGAVGPAGV